MTAKRKETYLLNRLRYLTHRLSVHQPHHNNKQQNVKNGADGLIKCEFRNEVPRAIATLAFRLLPRGLLILHRRGWRGRKLPLQVALPYDVDGRADELEEDVFNKRWKRERGRKLFLLLSAKALPFSLGDQDR